MKNIFFILIILGLSFQSLANKKNEQFDLLLNDLFSKDGPGGVALVTKNGEHEASKIE